MEKNQPIVTSMRMKTFDEDSVKKELVMGDDRAEEASNIRDSPDSGHDRLVTRVKHAREKKLNGRNML